MLKLTVTTDSHIGASSLSPKGMSSTSHKVGLGWPCTDVELEVVNAESGQIATFRFTAIPADPEDPKLGNELIFPPGYVAEDNGDDGLSISPP